MGERVLGAQAAGMRAATAAAASAVARADELGRQAGVAAPPWPRGGVRRSARFAVEQGMVTPGHARLAARYLTQRARHPQVAFGGMAFFGRHVELICPPDRAHLQIGPWCWVGSYGALRVHEGSLRLGAKVVLGTATTVNAYLDVEIGDGALLSDWVYVGDFDHRFDRLDLELRAQGIKKSPVRIGADVWIGEKVTVLRGADIGTGSVIGSQTVVKGVIPPFSVAVGSPARVIRSRLPKGMSVEEGIALRREGRPLPED